MGRDRGPAFWEKGMPSASDNVLEIANKYRLAVLAIA